MKLPPLLSVGDLIRLYSLTAKQKLGQNFLLNFSITDKIARGAGPLQGSTVLEIGPGPGSLTRSLLMGGCRKLIAVEKDGRFLGPLQMIQQASEGVLHVVQGDCLTVDEQKLIEPIYASESPVKVFGNLPFNVSTPLLLKWLKQIHYKKGLFSYGKVSMVLLFQLEVAKRIVAEENTEYYSRLSIMCQRLCKAKILFTIPGDCFVPAPKVDTGVVLIEPLESPIDPSLNIDSLEYICMKLFGQKRKTLLNSVKTLGTPFQDLLEKASIDKQLRPQQLSIKQWCQLTHYFEEIREKESITITHKRKTKDYYSD